MRVPDSLLRTVLAVMLLSACACAGRVAVQAPVLYPARVPLRAFPSVWIVGGALADGDLGARLAQHLAGDPQREVRRIDVRELEPLRAAGKISPLTLVVTLEAEISSDVRQRYDVVPMQYCDFYWGCFTRYQSMYSAQPELLGDVLMTVYEGPTARVLQTERFRALAYGPDQPQVRAQIVAQLVTQIERAVDVVQTQARIVLEPVKAPPVARLGLEYIRRGQWVEGRDMLERAALQLEGQSRRVQARVWYDLGIARWHGAGPAGLTQQVFEAAEQALQRALTFDGTPRYRGALEGLKRARENQVTLEEQRHATELNFGIKGASPGSR